MDYRLQTPLNGFVSLTDTLPRPLVHDGLYRILWVREGELRLEIDHVEIVLHRGDLITLTPLRKPLIVSDSARYVVLSFNSDFYCIYSQTGDLSCSGVLFHGSSHLLHLTLDQEQCTLLGEIVDKMPEEFAVQDDLHEEMLRLLLKRFIITCTRIARSQIEKQITAESVNDLVRKYYMLVDQHFKHLHKVSDYAEMLHRSPKTLTNAFASAGFPSPLRIIRERILSESRRLLIHTPMQAKEIAEVVGFDSVASFSRFFKSMTGQSISQFRESGIKVD